MQGNAVLFSEMTPGASWEREFNDWYDHEHIPLRMGVPGFVSAQRYCIAGNRDYLAVYEMNSPAVLKTPPYEAVKNSPSEQTQRMLSRVTGFTRYIGEQTGDQRRLTPGSDPLDAPCLYAVFFQVPVERQVEFNAWYEQDHVPLLLECPEWLLVRRFRIVAGHPEAWTHLALHYLADPRALKSAEREHARATPWRARLAQESWFNGKYLVFAKSGPRFTPRPTERNALNDVA